MFNLEYITKDLDLNQRYSNHLKSLSEKDFNTKYIENTVNGAIDNINKGVNSFVIYGDPQSGKTEMMIALTAKLLDLDHKIIIVLLNDNVGLLEQNLDRFAKSNLNPVPKKFSDIMDPTVEILDHKWVIFCKKNSSDLSKLIQKLDNKYNPIIIDDEADYASPNSKINSLTKEKTKINELVEKLLSKGIYIGVTATPARLDLNNTFKNENTKWVPFESHEFYTGQDLFFPLDLSKPKYRLTTMNDQYDDPKFLRSAYFRFLVTVAYLNLTKPNKNYSMLIHTSGRKNEHLKDFQDIQIITNILKNNQAKKYKDYYRNIWEIAKSIYTDFDSDEIVRFIIENINRNSILVINSEKDKVNLNKAAEPSALFTIAIGGNIVSRGVTFNNLLSMYFTRNVKSKMQQDTYIQRARMFGNRSGYLEHFELTIPENLYLDWQKCFVFHKLAIQSVKSGNSPVWLENSRISAAAPSSIAKSTVEMNSGEMSFSIFDYSEKIESIINENSDVYIKLNRLQEIVGLDSLPQHLIEFINHFNPEGKNSLAIHGSTDISNRSDDTDKVNIIRLRGLIGNSEMELNKYPFAIHHIKIFYNENTKRARIFYRFKGSIRFLKNTRIEKND